MGNVGGSRHYEGGGLGPLASWHCPACGMVNAGVLERGCEYCGSGAPGRHVGTQPPAPPRARVSERAPDDPTYQTPVAPAEATEPEGEEQLGVFDRWALRHPKATLEDAFTAGYAEGVRAARHAQLAAQPATTAAVALSPHEIVNRTLVAALELFRDQVLQGEPEEVATGEWLSAYQVNGLIREIRGEVVRG